MATRKKISNEIHAALRDIRLAQRLSQEDFALASGRSYISELERGLRQPTLAKVDELAEVLGVHPLTILSLAYLKRRNEKHLTNLAGKVGRELEKMRLVSGPGMRAASPKALRRGER